MPVGHAHFRIPSRRSSQADLHTRSKPFTAGRFSGPGINCKLFLTRVVWRPIVVEIIDFPSSVEEFLGLCRPVLRHKSKHIFRCSTKILFEPFQNSGQSHLVPRLIHPEVSSLLEISLRLFLQLSV